MKKKRTINYYELSMKGNGDVYEYIREVMVQIQHNNATKDDKRKRWTSSGQAMIISEITQTGDHFYNCCMRAIRDDFPEVISKTDDATQALEEESDPDKGLYEETHFVICLAPSTSRMRLPVIAVESTMRGGKLKEIELFMNQTLNNLEREDMFLFTPIFAFDGPGLEERLGDVAEIKMVVRDDQIEQYAQYDPTTGDIMRRAQEYGQSEYTTLDFKINFQLRKERHETSGLRRRASQLIAVFNRHPEARDHLQKLYIRGEDSKYRGRLRLFDLIESKVASEVFAETKRDTSQYLLSTGLYEEIRRQIDRDFGLTQT